MLFLLQNSDDRKNTSNAQKYEHPFSDENILNIFTSQDIYKINNEQQVNLNGTWSNGDH